MDTANRSAVERPAGALSVTEYLLAAVAILGVAGRLVEGLARSAAGNGQKSLAELGGSIFRWQLCFCQKGGAAVGKTKRGKGSKWMVVVDGEGVPLGGTVTSASPAEVTLIEPLLEDTYGKSKIRRLIYDKAADSDPLRARLKGRRIDLICPHRKNRRKAPLQDGRKLRRYRRRWKVERTFSWIGNFRRLVVRWEKYVLMYRAFFYIACLWITLRKL